jgi:hypothetical protein
MKKEAVFYFLFVYIYMNSFMAYGPLYNWLVHLERGNQMAW